jgi:tryptophan-rich sensory protein
MSVNRETFRSWYDGLKKAPWNPPRWVFGPAWTLLYLTMGYASYRVLSAYTSLKWTALGIYWGQLVVNFTWSPIFFGLRRLKLALAIIILLWCLIVANLVLFLLVDTTAGALIIPYLLWVSYATTLNLYIVSNNEPASVSHERQE